MSKQLPKAVKRQILDPKIPKGWEVYVSDIGISVLGTYVNDARLGLDGNKSLIANIELVRYDVFLGGSFKVIITKKKRFIGFLGFRNKFHIGHLPDDIAKLIFFHNLQDVVKVRIRRSFIHADKSVSVFIDIIGPTDIFTEEKRRDFSNGGKS